MEVIRIPGYTEDEKLNIAQRYLLPKQMEQHGLKPEEVSVSEQVLLDIIRYYTRESGVRNLEREIAKICRKVVKRLALEKDRDSIAVTVRNLEDLLGVRQFRYGLADENNEIGQVTGLAWTQVGGELLRIEASLVPGKGKLTLTGHLGDVMKESIQAAMTVVRSREEKLGLEPGFHEKYDAHVHVPEGATPKDGPSAGVAMFTLRGQVLPIGGLKEKLLAAHRAGITMVIIPKENEKDLAEIPRNIKRKLDIRPVSEIDEVLKLALTEMPQPRLDEAQPESPVAVDSETVARTH
jgi:ATP-dependent Lon protease